MTQTAPSTALAQSSAGLPVTAGFFDMQGFELLQRIAKAFSGSDLVPKQYQNNLANCMIAMDMAQRMQANPLLVMQNLYMVHNQPGWSSKFLIATINSCGRYSSLRYEFTGKPGEENYGCRAWAIERGSNERLDGIWVTWKMVRAEGWSNKNGSKWLTMPDQMFIYRAAAFWQRAYAPELGMGLPTAEELGDVIDVQPQADGSYAMPEVIPEPVSKSAAAAAKAEAEPEPAEKETNQAQAPAEPAQAATKTVAQKANPATGELPPVINAGQVKYLESKIKALEMAPEVVTAMLLRIGADNLQDLTVFQFDIVKAELLSMGA